VLGHFGRLINVPKAVDKVTGLIKNTRHPPKENCFLQNTFSVAAETEQRNFDQRRV
jgi:hypothetical protein